VLCVLQVAFEGFISQKSIQSEMSRSSKASGAYHHHVHSCFELLWQAY
jgi:tRNA(Met) C34 N-acetyltransferase TmcA